MSRAADVIEDIYPLAPVQEGMLFHTLDAPHSGVYLEQIVYELEGFDTEMLAEAWRRIVDRHDVLRSSFVWEELEQPVQVVHKDVDLPIERRDWSDVPSEVQRERLKAFLERDRERGLDLTEAPVMRLALIHVGEGETWMVWTHHHILLDGWSVSLVVDELRTCYRALMENEAPTLPPSRRYRDYVTWVTERDDASADRFWREELGDLSEPTSLCLDEPSAAEEDEGTSFGAGEVAAELPQDVSSALADLARQAGVTLNTVLQAAWAIHLHRYSGDEEVVFGTTLSGRPTDLKGVEDMVGLFINTLPLKVHVDPERRVDDWLADVRSSFSDVFQRQHTPLNEVQRITDVPAGEPLFESIFVFQNYPGTSNQETDQDLRVDSLSAVEQTNYPVNVIVSEGSRIVVKITYDPERLGREAARGRLDHLRNILVDLARDPEQKVREVRMLGDGERSRLLDDWGRGRQTSGPGGTIVDAFEQVVRRRPDDIALSGPDRTLTYADLGERVHRLARVLGERLDTEAEARVALCLPRAPEYVVAMLAVLEAGACYVPLDPETPEKRVRHVLEEADPDLVLTVEGTRGIPSEEVQTFDLDRQRSRVRKAPSGRPETSPDPDDLAYTIFTSGSTGAPKGVLVDHDGLLNYATWFAGTSLCDDGERAGTVLHSSLAFDLPLTSVYPALIAGQPIHVLPPEDGPGPLADFLAEVDKLSYVKLTPSHLRLLQRELSAEEIRGTVGGFVIGGEALFWGDLASWAEIDPSLVFVNEYGPAEAVVGCSASFVQDRGEEEGPVPIGRPIANMQTLVLDDHGQPVPVGVPGELHVAGPQLARGYLGRPELTDEAFCPHPFSEDPDTRVYETGDLVRWRHDGSLEFLGRKDDQVNVRGFRVETGEIEAALVQHERVQQAVVEANTTGEGDTRLIGYVEGDEHPGGGLREADLREHLAERVPEYMVPHRIVVLDEFPLTPNGKVDRDALPEPGRPATSERSYRPPSDPVEEALANVWSEVLDVDKVGVEDNFFELGGDSILTIRIVARAKKHDIHVTPREVFNRPTIRQLADVVREGSTVDTEQGPVTGEVPLAPVQAHFLDHSWQNEDHYNQARLLEAPIDLDADALAGSLEALTSHHDMLRARFPANTRRGSCTQRIEEPGAGHLPLERIDLSHLENAAESTRLREMRERATALQASLDLERGPVVRAGLFDLGSRSQRLLLVVHHLVVDEVSWPPLLEDLNSAYTQAESGDEIELPPKTTSYEEWVDRLRDHAESSDVDASHSYWAERLASETAPSLPRDRDGQNTHDSEASLTLSLSEDVTEALVQDVPKTYNTRLDEVLVTALSRVLARWTDRSRIAIELEGHGREPIAEDVDLSRTVGWFATLYPAILDLSSPDDVGACLTDVKEQLRRIPNDGLDYTVLERFGAETDAVPELPKHSRPEVRFNYLGRSRSSTEPGSDRPFEPCDGPTGEAGGVTGVRDPLLEVLGLKGENELRFSFRFSGSVHETSTIESLAEAFRRSLAEIVEHCEDPETGGRTPADFPLVELDPATLDRLEVTYEPLEDVYPMTPMQEGMVFHSLDDEGGLYVEQMVWSLSGVDADTVARAWEEVVQTHEVFRTAFPRMRREQPIQVVQEETDVPVEHRDWRDLGDDEARNRLEGLMETDRDRGFDLARPPLMRVTLLDVGDDELWVLWTHHHAITDGWSTPLVMEDLLEACRRLGDDREPRLSSPRRYRDYVGWLEDQDQDAAESFWKERLEGFESPTEVQAPEAPPSTERTETDDGARGERWFSLSEDVTSDLRAAARRAQVTSNTLFQAAWAVLLSRYAGEEDIVHGATVSGRPANLRGVEEMVGLFINSLPVRTSVRSERDLSAFLEAVQNELAEAREHGYAPLADIQSWSDVPGGTPLFETIVAYQNYRGTRDASSTSSDDEVELEVLETVERVNYDLSLTVVEGEPFAFRISHDPSTVSERAVDRVANHLRTILDSLASGEAQTVGDLTVLTDEERERLLEHWATNRKKKPLERTIPDRLAAKAQATPQAVALAQGDRELTYAEMQRRSNRLARVLAAEGVRPGDRVGLALPRGVDWILAILATLKAGAAYVPLDPDYPEDRLAYMLKDADAELLVSEEAISPHLASTAPNVLVLDDSRTRERIRQASSDPLDGSPSPEDPAYVIYTSGSTGRPKGVEIEHASVVNLAASQHRAFDLRRDDVVLQFAPASFDASVFEIFGTLLNGATLVLPARDETLLGEPLAEALREAEVTMVTLPPSALATLPDEPVPHLDTLVVAGEPCPPHLVNQWSTDRTFINAYGPTEATVCSTGHVCSGEYDRTPPIGRPIGNVETYVLNDDMDPVPVGVSGELYIGGASLGRYLESVEVDEDPFVAHPFSEDPNARLYRSGDVVAWRGDGTLDFEGRVDHQLQVRGHRVEPGEIENQLTAREDVERAVVVDRERGDGSTWLVAYVTRTAEAKAEPEPGALRDDLTQRLPSYMVPSRFVVLEEFPLTPSGKIDRDALPDPFGRPTPGSGRRRPLSPLERDLAEIWDDVLDLDGIGADEDFFELGGHSLLAMKAAIRARETLGVDLPIRWIFENPTVSQLATEIQRRDADEDQAPLDPAAVEVEERPPLSFEQERLFFIDQLRAGSPEYNVSASYRLEGSLDIDALASALSELVERHEVLRTTYETNDEGEPVQRVHEEPQHEELLQVTDLQDVDDPEARAREIAEAQNSEPFDLEEGPVYRFRLLRLAEDESVLHLAFHHIAYDAWSAEIVHEELADAYEDRREDREVQLPETSLQYGQYATWQRERWTGEYLEERLAYWEDKLEGVSTLDLPTDAPRPPVKGHRGVTVSIDVSDETVEGLRKLARREGASLFMVGLAALKILLSRYTRQTDVAVGSPIAGRGRRELEDVVGFFVNTLVLRTDLDGDPELAEVVERVRETCLEAYERAEVPFGELVSRLALERDPSRDPLFQVLFALQNRDPGAGSGLDLSGVSTESFATRHDTSKFDLNLELVASGNTIDGTLTYDAELFEPATGRRLARLYEAVLAAIAEDPTDRVSDVALVDGDSRSRLVEDWGRNANPYPREASVVDLFEAQARETPGRVAVRSGDQELKYATLNTRADRAARALAGAGVEPGDRVATAVERTPERIVTVLAVLKAGASYVPLDPDYPEQRLAFMLQDADVAATVTIPELVDEIEAAAEGAGGPLLSVASLLDGDASASLDRGNRAREPDDEIYVMYTSGSTGKPKGVKVPHRGVTRLVSNADYVDVTPGDTVLHAAPSSFDAATFEIWAPLLNGATLALPPPTELDLSELADAIETHDVSTLWLTAPLFHAMVDRHLPALEGVDELLAGGDVLSPEHVERAVRDLDDTVIINGYGPTENTTFTTTHRIEEPADLDAPVPIGSPIANTRLLVLDEDGNPVPVGVPGELYAGGDGVALGYLDRPGLTEASFVPNPLTGDEDDVFYKTGDLVAWRPDGRLDFLGRKDEQVKVRGHRIEPGEIEHALLDAKTVEKAVVVPTEFAGRERLVAYVVPADGSQARAEDLRSRLSRELPAYMVPGRFVEMEAFPLSPNGKIDRGKLPEPDSEVDATSREPRTETERVLAAVWEELLDLEDVSVHDDFFRLGGDSITGLRVASRAAEHGVHVSMRDLFTHPTIAELAEAADDERRIDARQGSIVGSSPLTPIQAWFFDRDLPDPDHFNQARLVLVPRSVDEDRVREILDALTEHHDCLRSRFPQVDGERRQRYLDPSEARIPLDVADLTGAEDAADALREWADELHRSLDVEQGPIARAALLDVDEEEPRRLVLVIHHLVVDAVSWRIILEDLDRIHRQLDQGAEPKLPDKTTAYRTWAERIHEAVEEGRFRDLVDYWLDMSWPPSASLPVDHDEGPNTVASAETVTRRFSEHETGRLLERAADRGADVEALLACAVARAVAEWTGDAETVLELESHGREPLFLDADVSRTVGWFTTKYPVSIDLSDARGPDEAIERVGEELDAVLENGFPFAVLEQLAQDEVGEQLRSLPSPDVRFNFFGRTHDRRPGRHRRDSATRDLVRAHGPTGWPLGPENPRERLLEVSASVVGERLYLSITFSENKHEEETIADVATYVVDFLRDAADEATDTPAKRKKSPATGGEEADYDPVVPIDPAGSLPPLYGVHEGSGGVGYYRNLAEQLDDDRPLFAFMARGLAGEHEPHRSIQAMAECYARALRDHVSSDEYALTGWSMGGPVALETARLLDEEGQGPASLVLVDPGVMEPGRLRCRESEVPAEDCRRRDEAHEILHALDDTSSHSEVRSRLASLEWVDVERDGIEPALADVRLTAAFGEALSNYEPRPFEGDAVVLLTTETQDKWPRFEDDWEAAIRGRLETVVVPGEHDELLSYPYVREVSPEIQRRLPP